MDMRTAAPLFTAFTLVAWVSLGCGGSPSTGSTGGGGSLATTSSSTSSGTGGSSLLPLDARCPTPAQDAVDRTGWPEIFVGTSAQGCSDAEGSGSRAAPFCNPHLALSKVNQAATIVTLMDGEYRLDNFVNASNAKGGLGIPSRSDYSASQFFVLRADKGATPVILGSIRLSADWKSHGTSPRVFRIDVSGLPQDPKALYRVEDQLAQRYTKARRFRHMMVFREGVRSHADVASLLDGSAGKPETSMTEDASTNDFTWTKADAGGAGCGAGNAGCFIYLRADSAAFDPNGAELEVSQYNAIGGDAGQANHLVIDGVHTRFTQCGGLNCSVWFDGSNDLLIQNSSFGHVANSDDNSYALGLWQTNGSIVRRNAIFDSAYWGGTPNSKGLTFMISGATAPNWVCGNEIYHIPGDAGVGSKNGVKDLRIVGNYIHDSVNCVSTNQDRTQGGVFYEAGSYVIQQNVFERCQQGVRMARPSGGTASADVVLNNLFIDNVHGVRLAASTTPASGIFNNIFIGGPLANACDAAGACGAGVYFANNGADPLDFAYILKDLGVVLSNNLYFGLTYSHGVNRNWTANYANYTLSEIQKEYGAEASSLSEDPLLDADHVPASSSPVIGRGLGKFYDEPSVNIGVHLH
jgi:hypothetical protein